MEQNTIYDKVLPHRTASEKATNVTRLPLLRVYKIKINGRRDPLR
jgi:hypothetical protein